MTDTLRIKRRTTPAGAPAALANAELAYNEASNILYYGSGGTPAAAATIIPIAGTGAFLPLSGGGLTGGLNFGSVVDSAATSVAAHISLFGGNSYGFGITSNRLNYVVSAAANVHAFMVAGVDVVKVINTGVAMQSGMALSLAADPTTALQAATKQYVDNQLAGSVTSFNTRTGAVTLTLADVTGVGGAPLASPTFTGVPAAPTATAGTSTTQIATTAFVATAIPIASSTLPLMNAAAAIGTGTTWARADHVHPVDTSRAPLASPAFTGTPTAPTQAVGDETTNIANTLFAARVGTGMLQPNTGDADVTFTPAQLGARFINVIGTTTADRTITIPINLNQRNWVIRNGTSGGFNIALASTGTATFLIPPTYSAEFWTNGLNLFATHTLLPGATTRVGDATRNGLLISTGASPTTALTLNTTGTGALQYACGVTITNATSPGGNSDTSRHLTLYAGIGFNITSSRLNYNVTSGTAHVFLVNAVDVVRINNTGIVMQAGTAIALAADPTTALQAVTKQYVDSRANNDPVNVKLPPYNAVGNGVADDTTAIQNAINTGLSVYLPKGTYKISAQINCNNKGQMICGAGRNATFISVTAPSASFTTGIFYVHSLEVGPTFRDFCVMCTQPDTNSRAALNVYPPIFYLDVTPRCQFMNVRMVLGLNGIYMNGNCGGFRASGCDFGCFSTNIYIDGNVDVTSFTDCQVWCFSATGIMTTNQTQIFWDPNCYGLFSRRNDYLDWKGGLFMVGVSAHFDTGTRSDFPGTTYGHFVGTGFDTFGGLEVAAGSILTTNCVYSVGGDPNNIRSGHAVTHTGGNVTVRGGKFFVGTVSLIPDQTLIWTGCGSGVALIEIEGCEFELGGANVRAIYAETSNNAYDSLIIANNKFTRLAGYAYTVAAVEIKGGGGTFTGNTCGPGAGSMTGTVPAVAFPAGIGTWFTANNNMHGWTNVVTGSSITAANLLQLQPVIGDMMPVIQVNGNATIGGMTFNGEIGANGTAFPGIMVTLYFAGTCTVNAGSFGVAGQFLLNNGTAFATRTGSHLTVRLSTTSNWVEVGRCY